MGTFYNKAVCDFYLGQGAGKKLLEDINRARHSIKIISPYLTPGLIHSLIARHQAGVDVRLITMDNIEDYYGSYEKNIYKLIRQHRSVDTDAENVRNKWMRQAEIIALAGYGLLGISILSAVIMAERTLLYGMFPAIFLILLHQVYRHYIRNKRIYEYHYSQLFPFKVFRSPNKLYDQSKAIFIHGKIYIIDDRIVYTGSLNFTIGGTSSNYETRVRTEDPAAVRKIVDEFYALFNSPYDQRDIQSWGRLLYEEPIN